MRAEVIRKTFTTLQTTGQFILYDESGKVLFDAKTLELDVDGNKEGESCIPESENYRMIPLIDRHEDARFTIEQFGYFPYLVKGVSGRSGILFHHGNFHSDILGCILLGRTFAYLNTDDLKDVTNSVETFKELNKVLKEPCDLTVRRSQIDSAGIDPITIHDNPSF